MAPGEGRVSRPDRLLEGADELLAPQGDDGGEPELSYDPNERRVLKRNLVRAYRAERVEGGGHVDKLRQAARFVK